MNLVILVDSAKMFFRSFGLRHANAAVGIAIGLAAPNASLKIITRFARPVEWVQSRLRPQVLETSPQIKGPLEVCAAENGSPPNTDCGELR